MERLVNRNSLREQICSYLLKRIGAGSLQPGDRIVEAKLAKEMHVSSIPIREAIRELVAMRILESVHHKGARVREVSIPETIEALQVKAVLEGLASRLASSSLSGNCGALKFEVEKSKEAIDKRDFKAFQVHNQSFHRSIVEASGNSILLRSWDNLAFEVRTRVILDFLTVFDPNAYTQDHTQILAALEAGDGEKAAALLATHANRLVTYLKEELEKQNIYNRRRS